MINKTNSGRILSSLYKASVCNQSLHLPTHRSFPPSPTSFNLFILLIHLPIYPHTIQSIHSSCYLQTFLNTLHSLFEPQFSIFVRKSSERLLNLKHHPASYASSSTQIHLGAAQDHHSRLLRAPLEQLRIKCPARGHLESSGC